MFGVSFLQARSSCFLLIVESDPCDPLMACHVFLVGGAGVCVLVGGTGSLLSGAQ